MPVNATVGSLNLTDPSWARGGVSEPMLLFGATRCSPGAWLFPQPVIGVHNTVVALYKRNGNLRHNGGGGGANARPGNGCEVINVFPEGAPAPDPALDAAGAPVAELFGIPAFEEFQLNVSYTLWCAHASCVSWL